MTPRCPHCDAELNRVAGVVADNWIPGKGCYAIPLKGDAKRPHRKANFWTCPACEFATESPNGRIPGWTLKLDDGNYYN